MSTVIPHGTCPRCKGRASKRHCDSKTNRQCDWWNCNPCGITFDPAGRSVINPSAKGS